jgi:hypothetical protein
MKLISVVLARSVLLFDLGEFNPKGLNLWPVCEWLIERYRFSAYPKNLLDLNPEKALAFKAGSFNNSKGENILVSLAIYNNGIVADASSSTDDSDEFLRQVAAGIEKDFGLIVPPNAGRSYVSQLEVGAPEFSLSAFNPDLASFADSLSATVATVDGKPRKFDFGALQFWTEDVNPATSPAYFRFERKLGLPFSSNHYFSQAALETQDHLEFLGALVEQILKP